MKKVLSFVLVFSLALSMLLVMPVSAVGARYGMQMSLNGNTRITYEDSFWDYFGENLIKDPTVAAENFNGSGVYKRYSKIDADYQPVEINLNHWWDKYIDFNNGFYYYYKNLVDKGTVVLSGPDENGYYTIPDGNCGTQDTSYGGFTFTDRTARSLVNRDCVKNTGSLTDDGSGVIRVSGSANDRRLPLPAMESDSYYVVKFKMQTNGSSSFDLFLDLNYFDASYYYGFTNQNGNAKTNTGSLGSGQIDTVVFLVYTGDKAFSDPSIDVKNGNSGAYEFFDDFGVYEVSEEYAAAQSNGVKLTDPRSYIYSSEYSVSDGANYNGDVIYNVGDIDLDSHSKLGANLITDPTVNDFNAGVYSESGWWNSPAGNNYHGTPGQGGNVDSGDYLYASPAYRGLVKSDTSLSHTADGSGAIEFVSPDSNTPTNKVLLPTEALDSYSYYVLSFWIKSDNPGNTTLMFARSTTVAGGICSGFYKLGNDWQRIIAIIYTGNKSPSKSHIRIDMVGTVTVLLDDFGLYKMNDMNFGALCKDNNYIVRDAVSSEIVPADINASGTLNNFDIKYLRNYLLGNLSLQRTDTNVDGVSDIRDYMHIKNLLVP